MKLECPNCGSQSGECPECGKRFKHGTADRCDKPSCVAVNAPIDCSCGFVVAHGADGILDYSMNFRPFKAS